MARAFRLIAITYEASYAIAITLYLPRMTLLTRGTEVPYIDYNHFPTLASLLNRKPSNIFLQFFQIKKPIILKMPRDLLKIEKFYFKFSCLRKRFR